MPNSVWVYDHINEGPGDPTYHRGMQLERAMALRVEAQSALDRAAGAIQKDAAANLASVRAQPDYTGSVQSEVLPVESGSIDRFVVLSDRRGLWAAWMIERGGPAGRGGHRYQAGKEVLSKAAAASILRASGL